MPFLCYDIIGIHPYIFASPQLKYIIGGSALIDRFDKEQAASCCNEESKQLFSGGGVGSFQCKSESSLTKLKKKLIHSAHSIGINIRFGQSDDYFQAVLCQGDYYPYLPSPKELDGHPCQVSGRYPVRKKSDDQEKSDSFKEGINEHRLMKMRVFDKKDLMRRRYESALIDGLNFPQIKAFPDIQKLEFFHDVSEGTSGHRSLGEKNHWAVIYMDGNDMGNQFRAFQGTNPSPEKTAIWVENMSAALDQCTTEACRSGCERVINRWADERERIQNAVEGDQLTLPLRPLIVGGDDVVMLCHADYAFDFVSEVIRKFSLLSREKEKSKPAKCPSLWPATRGQLTISAGVLFCPISLPLHMAIPCAESLLSSAKSKGRSEKGIQSQKPSTSCIDFETVTESMLDSVSNRRNREMKFFDEESQAEVHLTQKPYTAEEFSRLRQEANELGEIPKTIRQQVLPNLRSSQTDRMIFLTQIAKRKNLQPLFQKLDKEGWSKELASDSETKILSTDVCDMIEVYEKIEKKKSSGRGGNL